MIDINLLSKELKIKITIRRTLEAIAFVFYVIFSISLVVSIIMFFMDITLANNVQNMESTRMNINQNYKDHIADIRMINKDVLELEKIQEQTIVWSDFLYQLSLLQTNDVLFNQLSASNNDKLIKISGSAKTRSALLSFKSLLDESGMFDDIELPLSNILEKENIEFTITAHFSDIN